MAREQWQMQCLDALRGIAMLCVLLVHCWYWGPATTMWLGIPYLNVVFASGQRGVQLFFIVSAFTLFLSLDNRKQETHPIRNFFLRRAFRITPMFLVATGVGLLFWREPMGSTLHILLSLLYLNNFSPQTILEGAPGGWSVSTEAVFYALLPFAWKYIRTPGRAAAVLAGCGLYRFAAVHFIAPRYGNADFWLFFSILPNLGVFAMGIALYFLWRDHLRHWKPEASRQWSLVVLVLAVVLFLERPANEVTQLLSGSLLCLLLATSLLLYPWRIFVNKFLIFFGKISFSFYLLHFCVMHLIEPPILSHCHQLGLTSHGSYIAVIFVATLAVTVPLSALTWRYIEEPGVRLGRSLIHSLEGMRIKAVLAEQQF